MRKCCSFITLQKCIQSENFGPLCYFFSIDRTRLLLTRDTTSFRTNNRQTLWSLKNMDMIFFFTLIYQVIVQCLKKGLVFWICRNKLHSNRWQNNTQQTYYDAADHLELTYIWVTVLCYIFLPLLPHKFKSYSWIFM